ncbi:serine/threonine protein kinase [Aphelenchoides avenae]|nr:serine/threonine protein kinase [Aphelenchus avenae]
MSYKDDCESWFYLLINLILPGGLPWAKQGDKDEVMRIKDNARENHGQEWLGKASLKCKDELWKVLDYLDHLTYFDRVDYNYIYALLKLAAKNSDVDLDSPYDWEDTKPVITGSVKKSSSEKPDQSSRTKKSKKL